MKKITFLLSILCLPLSLQAQELNKELQEFSKKSKASEGQKAIMMKSFKDIEASGILKKVPQKGETLKDAELVNAKGEKTKLYGLIGDQAAVITFYRGGWCPYCNMTLRHYQKNLDKIKDAGAKLIAISPQVADDSLSTQQKNNLEFSVLSDLNNDYARSLNIVFPLGDELTQVYKEYGINLEKNQGNDKWELPLAATFVVDKDKKIQYVFTDIDYKKRAEMKDILKALKKQKK